MQHYKDLILAIILKHLPQVKVIAYGSRARGDWKEGSDIDIALDAQSKIDQNIVAAIINELEESTLPINFDIVDLHAASEELRKEIEKDGVLWKK